MHRGFISPARKLAARPQHADPSTCDAIAHEPSNEPTAPQTERHTGGWVGCRSAPRALSHPRAKGIETSSSHSHVGHSASTIAMRFRPQPQHERPLAARAFASCRRTSWLLPPCAAPRSLEATNMRKQRGGSLVLQCIGDSYHQPESWQRDHSTLTQAHATRSHTSRRMSQLPLRTFLPARPIPLTYRSSIAPSRSADVAETRRSDRSCPPSSQPPSNPSSHRLQTG